MTKAIVCTTTLAALAGLLAGAGPVAAQTTTVAFYHNTVDHAGLFVVPGLTQAAAAKTTVDTAFNGAVSGVTNATLLYWRPSGATTGDVIVATENDMVYALNETTGLPVWTRSLGTAAAQSSGCGNINPVGTTSTPVIDTTTGRLYVEAVVAGANGPVHDLFALSLATGALVAGWPVALDTGLQALGISFSDAIEEQRGALALMAGNVYVPFGGYYGDCGNYHGIIAAVATATHKVTAGLSTGAEKGGIWAPGGVVSDGTSLYFSTGNTEATSGFAGGEAVARVDTALSPVRSTSAYFAPSNWKSLDNDDYDVGGVSPTVIDLAGSSPAHLTLALGKDGNAYQLNRENLGGVSAALQTLAVTGLYTHSSTARFTSGAAVMVAFNAQKPFCSTTLEGLVALSVTGGAPPKVASAWCNPLNGRGDPIVTTTDGTTDPIVWVTGAEGDEALHAFDGVTGAALFTSPAAATTIRHFTSLLVANGKIFVPSDNKVIAYDLNTAK